MTSPAWTLADVASDLEERAAIVWEGSTEREIGEMVGTVEDFAEERVGLAVGLKRARAARVLLSTTDARWKP